MEEYRIEVKVKNNLILRKLEELGFNSVMHFCKVYNFQMVILYKLINMKSSALTQKGEFTSSVNKLCEILNCAPEELFSATQMEAALETNKRTYEVKEAEMKFMLQGSSEPKLLEDIVLEDQKKDTIEEILNTVTPRERKVLEMRFGLGEYDKTYTLAECGKEFNITGNRIREIQNKALRKLRHPTRSDPLKGFLS